MRAGADVYVEKPPVASMADFERLLRVQEETGRAVQVGFQSLGSHALDAIAAHGTVWSVAAHATWLRDRAYWSRSPWAGKRVVDGKPMIDGVATNPLAHAVATALRIAGARRREDVASVEVELYRANDIESDDTTSLRVRLASGEVVSAALTLCAAEQHDPELSVRTDAGELTFWYTRDELAGADAAPDAAPDAVRGGLATGTAASVTHGRTDLFENLLAHRATGEPLLSSLVDSGAYMEVLEAIRTHDEPLADRRRLRDLAGRGRRGASGGRRRRLVGAAHRGRGRAVQRDARALGRGGAERTAGDDRRGVRCGGCRGIRRPRRRLGRRLDGDPHLVAASVPASGPHAGGRRGERRPPARPRLAPRAVGRGAARRRRELLGRTHVRTRLRLPVAR